MKVAILYGGKSGEHEVSLISAASVVRNIKKEHKLSLIGITRDGSWYLQPDTVLENAREGDGPLELKTDCPAVVVVPGKGLRVYSSFGSSDLLVEVVFPVLHGTYGEDGTIQGLLECAGIAYVGADVLGSAISMDKEVAKTLWRDSELPVVPSITVHAGSELTRRLDDSMTKIENSFGWPVFVKPARAGSSVGASRVTEAAQFGKAAAAAFAYDTKILVEPFMSARELECSVLGNDEPKAFEPGEIIPSHEFYDYEAKYIDPDGARLMIPAEISQDTKARIMDLAIKAYHSAKLSGMARIDFFMDKHDGKLYLNEANTIPGFTHISMFPKMCEAGGLPYPELIEELLSLAKNRKQTKDALRYEYN
ncbi:MAG: D-alanine--D-alanine ligase family protein [Spirochaetia bacterium]|jgi:D-alanine-D-alanine ligase|nr:D-alanine--D-alanine ligase family protein [Spirochaetia bacterium]